MTDELIKALEEIIAMQPGGQSLTQVRYIAREALAAHRSQQEAAQEPVAWQGIHEPWDLWIKKPEGIEVRPLFTSTAPSESEARDAARYRWLRRGGSAKLDSEREEMVKSYGDHYLDEAIDAAMSASGQKGEPK